MIPAPRGVRVFAVEDTCVQVHWSDMGVGELTVWSPGGETSVPVDGPGCADVDGLAPDTELRLRYRCVARTTTEGALRVRTLPRLDGPELGRIALLTDVHLGRRSFGLRRIQHDDPHVDPHPLRCARAAAHAFGRWGAERLIIKGDLVESSRVENWALAAALVKGIEQAVGHRVEIDAVAGNHEVNRASNVAVADGAASAGIRMHTHVESLDIDGLRVVFLDSAIPRLHSGRWSHRAAEVAAAVAGAAGGALIVTHHQPHRWPVQTYFPPGVARSDSRVFIDAVRRANPATMGTSGHTHRHRRHDLWGIPWTETGSVKDYPGTWTGLVIHEGGVRQVVRRVEDHGCLTWLDGTANAAGGTWGRWSPGRLADRCFTWRWPSR